MTQVIHANSAAVGVLHPAAGEQMAKLIKELTAHNFYPSAYQQIAAGLEHTRAALAAMIQTDPSNVALTHSTSDGLAAFIAAFPFSPGDVVVRSRGNFASIDAALTRLKMNGVEDARVGTESGLVTPADLAASSPRTRLAIIDWVNYRTGARNDLQPLIDWSHRFKIPLLIDGVQGLGTAPVDFDMAKLAGFTCGGHKWLRGPEGTGFLYVAPWMLPRLTPRHYGYRSLSNPTAFEADRLELSVDARVFEVGTLNTVGFAGLGAVVQAIRKEGPARVAARVRDTAGRVYQLIEDFRGIELVTPADPARRAGIVSFRHPYVKAEEIRDRLLQQGLVVGVRAGCVRVSADADTNAEAVLEKLSKVLGQCQVSV